LGLFYSNLKDLTADDKRHHPETPAGATAFTMSYNEEALIAIIATPMSPFLTAYFHDIGLLFFPSPGRH
jgi:hypothetical protein